MSKVVYRGKERTHLTVGAGGMFDFADPQAAWDSISDSSISKPYLIELSPGIYEQDSPSAGEPAWAFRGKTDISIVGSRAAILRKTGTVGGGTVGIGAGGSLAERIRLDGFMIINPLNGASEGGAPEGGLYLGDETNHPTTLPFDDIEIVNCHILGVHDALQIFGTQAPGGGPTVPPLVYIRNNLMGSRHDTYTIKGGVRLHSSHNQIIADSASTFGGYLTSIDDWKTTGIHYNHGSGTHTDDAGRGDAFSIHTGEQIRVLTNDHVDTTGPQHYGCGVLNYKTGAADMSYPQTWTGCHIRLRNLFNENVRLWGVEFDKAVFPEDEFIWTGGSIHVINESAGASAPDTIAGVHVGNTTQAECRVRISNTHILAVNAKTFAYSLMSEDEATNVIKHGGVTSDQVVNAAGGGVVTHVAPRTDSAP